MTHHVWPQARGTPASTDQVSYHPAIEVAAEGSEIRRFCYVTLQESLNLSELQCPVCEKKSMCHVAVMKVTLVMLVKCLSIAW